jgi:hypothetical protein
MFNSRVYCKSSSERESDFELMGTGLAMDRWMVGVRSPVGSRGFSMFRKVQTLSGVHQPPVKWILGVFP